MSEELKPCPRCASHMELVSDGNWHSATCRTCGTNTWKQGTRDEVVATLNRRVETPGEKLAEAFSKAQEAEMIYLNFRGSEQASKSLDELREMDEKMMEALNAYRASRAAAKGGANG